MRKWGFNGEENIPILWQGVEGFFGRFRGNRQLFSSPIAGMMQGRVVKMRMRFVAITGNGSSFLVGLEVCDD